MFRGAIAILPEVRELLREDPSQLSELLDEIHEEDLADLLELLDDAEAAEVLKALPTHDAAGIFERLEDNRQEVMVEVMGIESVAPIVSEMSDDDRTDLIEGLPDELGESLLATLERVDPEAAAEVEELARYEEDTAGGLMTTAYIEVAPELTVADAIERIRSVGEEAETIYYVYVLDKRGRLLGVVSLRDLLLASSTAPILEVMTENVVTVRPETDQEEVARTMARYDFSALPVTDEPGKLLGVITVDDVIDVLTQEQTEDVQRLGGVEPIEEGYFHTGFWTFVRKRMLWLSLLFVGQFFTGTALRHFDVVIQSVATLSFYIPLLISTGGNSGSQSASLIIRGLAVGDITTSHFLKVFLRELGQGLVMGIMLAAVGVFRVWLWGDGIGFMITFGLTLVVIVTMGCVVGAMFPLLLRRIGLDPATSSAPFIATVIDLLGIVAYFSVAQIVLADVIAQSAASAAGAGP